MRFMDVLDLGVTLSKVPFSEQVNKAHGNKRMTLASPAGMTA